MARDEHLEAEWLALLQGAEQQGRELWRETLERMADAPWAPPGAGGAGGGTGPDGAGKAADDGSDPMRAGFHQLWLALAAAGTDAGTGAGDPSQSAGDDGAGESLDEVFQQLHGQLDALFRMLDAATVPGTVLRAFREAAQADTGAGAAPPWVAAWARAGWLRLGPLRPHQERLETLLHAFEAYQESSRRCLALLHGAARSGLIRLHRRLAGRDAAGEPVEPEHPESLRALYGLWIEESEHAYEELLHSEAWADAFGACSNASEALLSALQEQADTWLRMLDLPNREDLIDTERRVLELERRERTARRRSAGPADEVEALRREVAALREEVRNLGGSPDGA